MKADFSEQLQGRKERATEPPRGFRVNGGNLRPANRAGQSETAREREKERERLRQERYKVSKADERKRERKGREDRERKRFVRRRPQEDGATKKNCGKGRRRTKEW